MAETDDGTKRAKHLRDCATEARSVARLLGPYLDDAVKKASPRATLFGGGAGDAIWQGPFADASTQSLKARQRKLSGMATALLADAKRWEAEATALEGAARNKSHSGGGH